MASWKFTDMYGDQYPALANSILSVLVFDVVGSSPVSGTAFSASLDLSATGLAMNVLAELAGVEPMPMTGTVKTDDETLTVNLTVSDGAELTKAFAGVLPIIGSKLTDAGIGLTSSIPASLTADDVPSDEEFDINLTLTVGSGSGELVAAVPMSDGSFHVAGTFENLGIGLSDLNFLVPGSKDFSACFPATELGPYYDDQTTLELINLGLSFYVATSPSLSITASDVSASIGITNIPIYQKALYLDPLAVSIHVADVDTAPVSAFGLEGNFVLCNYQTPGDTAKPGFTFDLQMAIPNPPSDPDSDFSLSGNFDNPCDTPVSQIINDLLGEATDTGIGGSITLEKFDFSTDADGTTGMIKDFECDIGMSGQIGLFESLPVESFSISLAYSNDASSEGEPGNAATNGRESE